MRQVGKFLLLFVLTLSLMFVVATFTAAANPIHFPGRPLSIEAGAIGTCGGGYEFTPIHYPGSP